MSNSKTKSIKNSILYKIKNGDIKKLPKVIFNVKSAFFIVALFLVLSFSVFVLSFIVFSLQISGLWKLSFFGIKGFQMLISNLPWIIILLVIGFIVILEIMVNRYSFSYRKPFLYTSLMVICLVVVTSLVIRKTSFDENFYSKIEQGKIPAFKPLYEKYVNPSPEYFHPGTLIKMEPEGFILELHDKKTIFVRISEKTEKRIGFEIYPGTRLLVVGKIVNEIIDAEIIDNAPSSGRP